MLDQLQQVQKMGPIGQVMSMIPGMGGMAKEAQAAVDRGDLRRTEAIIRAMTPRERRDPADPQRLPPAAHRGRRRDRPFRRSTGSIKQFTEMQKMMKQLAGRRSARPPWAACGPPMTRARNSGDDR